MSKQLGDTLSRVKEAAAGGNIIHSQQIKRQDREILVRTQWLQEIIKGWYFLTRPDAPSGTSTTWYAHFWEFLQVYLEYHYQDAYCLSAESSLDLYTGATQVPSQVIVVVSKGGNRSLSLPYQTSLFIYVDKKELPQEKSKVRELQAMSLPLAICRASPTYFQNSPRDAEIALRLIRTASELSEIVIKYGLKKASERLLGAYRFLGDTEMVESLQADFSLVGWKVPEVNPFSVRQPPQYIHVESPYSGRILSMWRDYREQVIPFFPESLQLKQKPAAYLDSLEELYEKDAYNSLSIEGYQVNAALIDRVQSNQWDPDNNPLDMQEKNALAARGYFEAFQEVKNSLTKWVKNGSHESVELDLKKWYLKLFSPMVYSGLISKQDLLGYRKEQVYIRNSTHVPLPRETLIDAMETLFKCLQEEEHPAVRAVLGHYIFVYIHPYMDGNGRLGRFLMNALFVSGGYPWTIIEVENRKKYLDALEVIGTDQDIKPFAAFIAEEMRKSPSGGWGHRA